VCIIKQGLYDSKLCKSCGLDSNYCLIQSSQALKIMQPLGSHSEERCEIQSGGQEIAVMAR